MSERINKERVRDTTMIDAINNKQVIDQLEFLKNRLHEDDSIAALNKAIEVLNEHDLTTSAIEQALDNFQNNTKFISTKNKQEKMDTQQALSVLKDMHKANKHLSNQDDMGSRKDSFKEAADALAIAIKSLETPKYLYNLLQCIDGKIYTIGNPEEFKETNCANCKYKNEEQ